MLNDGFLKNYAFETPEKFWEKTREVLKEDTFLLSAFDIAAWDRTERSKACLYTSYVTSI